MNVRHRLIVMLTGTLAAGSLAASLMFGAYLGVRGFSVGSVAAAGPPVAHSIEQAVRQLPVATLTPTAERLSDYSVASSPATPLLATQTPRISPMVLSVPTETPSEFLISSVPAGRQARNLSCEFQTASDLAWYYGKPFTWLDVFMQVGHDPSGNPHRGFVGSSLDGLPGQLYPEGYGVYAEPIAQALRSFGLPAEVHYRESPAWVREQISSARPVMIWATGRMAQAQVEMWTTTDGVSVNGVRGEHTYLVVGYTVEGIWVLDPWDGQRRFYLWDVFLRAWSLFDRMAVVIAQ